MSEGSKPKLKVYLLIAYVIPSKWPKIPTLRTFNQTIRSLTIDAPTERNGKVYPRTGVIPVPTKILEVINPYLLAATLNFDRRVLERKNGESAFIVIKEKKATIISPYCSPPPTNWTLPPGELTLLGKYAITFNKAKKSISITDVKTQRRLILLKGYVQNSNFRRQDIQSFYRKVCKNSRSVFFVHQDVQNVFDKIACIDLEGIELYKSGGSSQPVTLDIVVDA